MPRRLLALLGWLLVAAVAVAGCAQVKTTTKTYYEPYHVETPSASTEPKVVIFTEESAQRAGVTTTLVVADGDRIVVPAASLIYDKSGAVLVFVSPKPLTYHRVVVKVAKSDGAKVWLTQGPAVGESVVVIGSNQVWGAEQGVGH